MEFRRSVVVLFSAGLWLAGPEAFAQSALPLRPSIDDAEPIPRRLQAAEDPFAPTGIGTGGLRLYPALTIGGLASSNVTASPSQPVADAGLQMRPSLRIESDWVRHSWSAAANGDIIFYAGDSDLNGHGLDVRQRLRLDVRRDTVVNIESAYVLDQSGLDNSDVPATAVGYRTEHTLLGSAALAHDFGGFEGRVRTGVAGRVFDNVKLSGGGEEDNADRDYTEPSVALRTTYTDPPVIKPYVELAYAPRLHRLTHDRNGLKRDSDGYLAGFGAVVDMAPVWSGDLALTYQYREYDDPALDSTDAVGFNGFLTWRPTGLTSVVLALGTSISETASAGSSGSPTWTVALDTAHEVRENIALAVGGGVEIETNEPGTDVTYDASLGVSWKLNPALAWTASYDFTWLDAAQPARDYTEHRVSAGLTLSR